MNLSDAPVVAGLVQSDVRKVHFLLNKETSVGRYRKKLGFTNPAQAQLFLGTGPLKGLGTLGFFLFLGLLFLTV